MTPRRNAALKLPSPRRRIGIDAGWRFCLGDPPGAEAPGFDDSSWRPLDLPHDWSIEGPFREDNPSSARGAYLPGGVGWYRKSFALDEADRGKAVRLDFDGAHMNAEVWLNGRRLGGRPYGYASFGFDAAREAVFGGENVLAVRLDNSLQPCSRWYTGAGIYRHVWLTIAHSLRIAPWGVFVSTPAVSRESAEARVQVRVRNGRLIGAECAVEVRALDPDGKPAGEAAGALKLAGESEAEIDLAFRVARPKLWSPETPRLYRLLVSVREGAAWSDAVEIPFGIRDIRFDPNSGLVLNGQPVKLRGVCLHHDLGCLGAALVERALERQLEIMKEMGANAIRTSHNPPAPELLDLCDRMGLLVMDEAFDEWTVGKTPAIFKDGQRVARIPMFGYQRFFDAWAERDLSDLVLRDRNHPSVVLWSIGNEIPEQDKPEGVAVARRLAGVVRALDPTRPVSCACNNAAGAEAAGFFETLDVAGYNYRESLYAEHHARHPDRVILGSENATALAYWKRGQCDPDALPTDSHIAAGEAALRAALTVDFCAGLFLWTGIDYLGEPTPQSWPSRSSYFAPVDMCGFPKDAFYLYKAQWTRSPIVHLFPHWNWEGREGSEIPVWCYTNCESVELFLDGESLGVKSNRAPEELHLEWRVPYRPGVLRAVGLMDGAKVCECERATAGAPAALALSADRAAIRVDRGDAAFVTAAVLDSAGRLCPLADTTIEFAIEGEARLIGVDNGDPESHLDFKGRRMKALSGLCLAVVQSAGQPGEAVLTAKAEGLQPARIALAFA